MKVAIVGHVDHGKSTVIGRLLADTGALPEGKLEQVREYCARNARPFEYAFLLDALRDERAQGITIDVARVFFRTARRGYLIHDTPGHVEFLRNMVGGASRADAALLVLDAHEGIRENSRRHAYLLAMLGIRQVAVLVNKMDLLDRSEDAFRAVVAEFDAHLDRLGLRPAHYVPVVGRTGENLSAPAPDMAWYGGPTVLQILDGFEEARPPRDLPFRMPVQGVYKFTAGGDTRRIVAGSVESGSARPGDEVVFLPSGKRSRIRGVEGFPQDRAAALEAGRAGGFTLEEQVYVGRGEVACLAGEPPPATGRRFRTSLLWLGKRPLHPGRDYILKAGTDRTRARLEAIERVLDAATLEVREGADQVARNEVAECVISLARPLAFDPDGTVPGLSRFVLVDDYEISGGGLLREALPDRGDRGRGDRFGQAPRVVLLLGGSGDAAGARELEARLGDQGRTAYAMPAGACDPAAAALLADAGLVVLVPGAGFGTSEIRSFQEALPPGLLRTVWGGGGPRPAPSAAGFDVDFVQEPGDGDGLRGAVLSWTETGSLEG
jgi:bifunctional enzyme CysN/CysC